MGVESGPVDASALDRRHSCRLHVEQVTSARIGRRARESRGTVSARRAGDVDRAQQPPGQEPTRKPARDGALPDTTSTVCSVVELLMSQRYVASDVDSATDAVQAVFGVGTVTVPAGRSSVSFDVTGHRVGSTVITASLNGSATSATLVVATDTSGGLRGDMNGDGVLNIVDGEIIRQTRSPGVHLGAAK